MATTYYTPISPLFLQALKPAVAEVFTNMCRVKQDIVGGLHWVADFTSLWVCCLGEDDASVLDKIRDVTTLHDDLAETFLEYTHDSKRHHHTTEPVSVDIVDNMLPLTPQPTPETQFENGHLDEVPQDPTIVVVAVILPDDEPVVAEEVAHAHQPVEVEGVTNRPERGEDQVPPGPSQVFTVCQDVIEVKNHRRVATNGRNYYEAAVVAEIKNKMSLAKPTAANKLAVRRMADNIMRKHGLRPSHVREHIEFIIAGVFIPDKYDIKAAQMLASNDVADRWDEIANAGPRNGWQIVSDFCRFGQRRNHTSRVPPVTGAP